MPLLMNPRELEEVSNAIEDARYLVAMIELVAESGDDADVRFTLGIQRTAIEVGNRLSAIFDKLSEMVDAAKTTNLKVVESA